MYLRNFIIICSCHCLGLTLIGAENRQRKPYRLSILHLMPLTGYSPRTAYECRAASEIVAKVVNNRSDILPDYHVEIIIADESLDGVLSVGSTYKFLRNFEQDQKNSSTRYLSPVIVAGFYTTGCKSLGAILHRLDMVAFSIYCSSNLLTQRNRYPNLYLVRGTAAITAHGMVHFMTKIAGWAKVAIIGYLGNANDNANAQYMSGVAARNNVTVLLFDSVLDFLMNDTSLADSLKKSGARIISFWGPQTYTMKCLCYLLKNGLTGERYAFLVLIGGLAELSALPETVLPGCTKKMLTEQYKFTIGFGQPQLPFNKTAPSTFGYNANEFEVMFDQLTNSSRGFDYNYRYQCHDATMEAILTLYNAEMAMKKLNPQLSLRNYSNSSPIVSKFINKSAIQLDITGLRIGRIKYSPSGEPGTDVIAIGYVGGNGRIEYYGVIRQLDNTTGVNNEDFRVDFKTKMVWHTRNGQPPSDRSKWITNTFTVPTQQLIVLLIMVAVSLILTLLNTWRGLVKTLDKRERVWKIVASIGCIHLDATAILFSLDSSETVWYCRIFFLAFSLAIINGMNFSKIRQCQCKFAELLSFRHYGVFTGRSRFSFSATGYTNHEIRDVYFAIGIVKAEKKTWKNDNIIVIVEFFAFVAISVAIVTLWFFIDPIFCELAASNPSYEPEEDAYHELLQTVCHSKYQQASEFSLTGCNALILAISCFHALDLKNRHADRDIDSFAKLTLAIANSVITLVASVLLLLTLDDQQTQTSAISFASIIFSSTTTWLHS